MSSSIRARKAAALQAMREGRRGRLDDYEVKDEGDVYDIMEENEYQELVEKRRQREDFVVDDDGLGYYDDGEERLGDERNTQQQRRSGTNSLTAAALKKARRNKKLLEEKNASLKPEDSVQNTNKSMWEFVQRGAVQATVSDGSKKRAAPSAVDLDSLLDTLDTAPSTAKKSRRTNRRPPPPRSRSRSSRPRFHAPSERRVEPQRHEQHDSQDHDDHDDDHFHPFDDGHDDDYDDNRNDHQLSTETSSSSSPPTKEDVTVQVDTPSESKGEEGRREMNNESNESGGNEESNDDKSKLEEASKPAVPRRRLARPKLGKLSAPAQKALEKKDTSPPSQMQQSLSAPSAVDTNSASFKPERIAADTTAAAKNATKLESIVQKDGDGSFIDMFWIDAYEDNGDIQLFGKVEASPGEFVSCCAVVKGNLRNLFVLPREGHDMIEVHSELQSILQPACIPIKEGASWAGKPVVRKYAFEDPSIPREETQYFKVVYDGKYKVPSEQICREGGKSFVRILGAGASNLENFIIKRKLMGPCWVRLQKPVASPRPVSWCKLELQLESPKQVSRLDLTQPRPPPPIVTVSIKLKTVVNPKTHKSEVVSVSAICHKRVMLDTASDESTKHMVQLSLIRPLGQVGTQTSSLPHFPRDIDAEIKQSMPQLSKMTNERALLSRLFCQIGVWDPDVLVGHNSWGYDMQVLLTRCIDLKVSMWTKIGRRRAVRMVSRSMQFSNEWSVAEAIQGRVLCDTYLSAKEHLRETTYSLTHLAASQLRTQRTDIEPVDIPQWFQSSKTIVHLANHTLFDAQLVQRLMFKLQILPLSKQLTCVSGNLWSRTMKGNRAERTEYLLLHEFHQRKFIAPEKRRGKKEETSGSKAKYSGGLVLEPKKGYYDSFILLLDFNSLYPSLIQEYNLCFTTMDWSHYVNGDDSSLPPVPDDSLDRGVLPRVIKSLVDRRRTVKKLMKSEQNPEKKGELDIRQKALKLTANSMYGCLGFSNSRFYAQPIAALVTAMGRETLQKTVDIATGTVGLEVIYGDTDSIMINTHITEEADYPKVLQLGNQVKHEVNKLFKTLELEIDGTFRSMLLLKKKKYAAVTVDLNKEGKLVFDKEMKGLDLVRRDWCIQSKDTGRYVLDQVLSGEDRELVVKKIHDHLEDLAETMRKGALPLEKYVITKGLSKHPNDYPDGKSQPHVQVAKQMLKASRPVNTGDHIPYVICEATEEKEKKLSPVERAHHPDAIKRSNGVLKPDVQWYLTQQILPPTSRLVEPIEGTSQAILAEKLGLDRTKYSASFRANGSEINDEELVDYVPSSSLPDEERFKDVKKLHLQCEACGVESEFPGVFYASKDGWFSNGLRCVNPECERPDFWGLSGYLEAIAKISNASSQLVKQCMDEYYLGAMRCDDPACGLKTRQLSVAGGICLARGCTGKMHPVVSERSLHTQIKYLDSLFDFNRALKQKSTDSMSQVELRKSVPKHHEMCFNELHERVEAYLKGSAFNFIEPSFWRALFPEMVPSKQ